MFYVRICKLSKWKLRSFVDLLTRVDVQKCVKLATNFLLTFIFYQILDVTKSAQ